MTLDGRVPTSLPCTLEDRGRSAERERERERENVCMQNNYGRGVPVPPAFTASPSCVCV